MTETKNEIQTSVNTEKKIAKFGIYKSNIANWRKGLIEVATDKAPSYIIFIIQISNVSIPGRLIGRIKEIWLWTEDSCPKQVVDPVLSEWQAGTAVQIAFDDKEAEFDGSLSKA